MIFKTIKLYINILKNPEKEFSKLPKRKFENVLVEYLTMLLTIAIFTAIAGFIFYSLKSLYLDIFAGAEVNYIRMLNYSLGRSTSIAFFYLFAGTFFAFIIGIILNIFTRKIKLVQILSVVAYSLAPLLLFSWIPIFTGALLIWSLFLVFTGIKIVKYGSIIKKDSIDQRD